MGHNDGVELAQISGWGGPPIVSNIEGILCSDDSLLQFALEVVSVLYSRSHSVWGAEEGIERDFRRDRVPVVSWGWALPVDRKILQIIAIVKLSEFLLGGELAQVNQQFLAGAWWEASFKRINIRLDHFNSLAVRDEVISWVAEGRRERAEQAEASLEVPGLGRREPRTRAQLRWNRVQIGSVSHQERNEMVERSSQTQNGREHTQAVHVVLHECWATHLSYQTGSGTTGVTSQMQSRSEGDWSNVLDSCDYISG